MSELETHHMTRSEAIQRILLAQSTDEKMISLKQRISSDIPYDETSVTNDEMEKVLELLANRRCKIKIK